MKLLKGCIEIYTSYCVYHTAIFFKETESIILKSTEFETKMSLFKSWFYYLPVG